MQTVRKVENRSQREQRDVANNGEEQHDRDKAQLDCEEQASAS